MLRQQWRRSRPAAQAVAAAIEPLETRQLLSVLFAPRVDYPAGATPAGIISADFNGDQKPDLAVVGSADNSVGVLLNNGDGTFAAKVNYAVGANPQSVAAADFDGDGRLDLAVVNRNDNTVSVLHNNGDGTFAAKVGFATGTSPAYVVAADWNGDGRKDLAVACAGIGKVSILLNNGTGGFNGKVDYSSGAGTVPVWLAVADLNQDGRVDLAAACSGGTLSIMLNGGGGVFFAPRNYLAGASPSSVAAADFNGDGRIDLTVSSKGDNSVGVFTNTVTGAFAGPVVYLTGSLPAAVISADFSSDGRPDLAVASSTGIVSILRNQGDGMFTTRADYPAGGGLVGLSAADYNGDGRTDLAASTSSNSVAVFLAGTGPANDNFADRLALSGYAPKAAGSNVGATGQVGEPSPARSGAARQGPWSSVWWTWTAPMSAPTQIDTRGSAVDTLLGVYVGNSVTTLTQVASNDDVSASVSTSQVIFNAVAGMTYQIAVDGWNDAMGDIALNIHVLNDLAAGALNVTYPAAAPRSVYAGGLLKVTRSYSIATLPPSAFFIQYHFSTNTTWGDDDDIGIAQYELLTQAGDQALGSHSGNINLAVPLNATPGIYYLLAKLDSTDSIYEYNEDDNILVGDTVKVIPPPNDSFGYRPTIVGAVASTSGTNINATLETGEPKHGDYTGGTSVWWTWVAPDSGRVQIDTIGSNFDTLLGVYTGTKVSALSQVAGNNNLGPSYTASAVAFNAVRGQAYQIAVDGYWGVSGNIKLNVNLAAGVLDDMQAVYSPASAWPIMYGGYLGMLHYSGPGTGSNTASWSFANIVPGIYRISATWTPGTNRASDAPFGIYDGAKLLWTSRVNQKLAPVDIKYANLVWQSLGYFNVTTGNLTVRLSNKANFFVLADAVRIERYLAPTAKAAKATPAATSPALAANWPFADAMPLLDRDSATAAVLSAGPASDLP